MITKKDASTWLHPSLLSFSFPLLFSERYFRYILLLNSEHVMAVAMATLSDSDVGHPTG